MTRAPLALLLVGSLARAAGPSALWDDVAHPDRPACDARVKAARAKLPDHADPAQPEIAAAFALAAEAARRCPDHLGAQSLLGHAIIALKNDFAGALAPLERARKLEDADPRRTPEAQLAFDLGLARAVAGDLLGSVEEYHRAEAIGLSAAMMPTLYYDLGDSLHALGRVGEAIVAYRRAVKLAPREAIHHWALAVALDRDGQLSASRAELEAALVLDPGLLAQRSERYFFLPPADQWYYLAIAYRAQGHLAEARQAVANFLHDLPDGPYAARARELQATLQR
jgi:tetratricopeptide (TPR) repeat protein